MAFQTKVCTAAVVAGALVRVIPSPSHDAALRHTQYAALGLTSVGHTTDLGISPIERIKVSQLRPEVPLLALAGGRLLASPNRQHLLACTPGGVLLLSLPDIDSALNHLVSCPPTNVTVVGDAHPSFKQAKVVDVRWHPLSDQHFVVLSTDGARLFDVSLNCSVPVQEWLFTGAGVGSKPAACMFGVGLGWESFTLFILSENGGLFHVTPIVPFGCVFPVSLWNRLQVDLHTTRGLPSVDADVAEACALSLLWLEECFVDIDSSWKRFTPRDATSKFSSALVDSRRGVDRVSQVTPNIQGPINVLPALPTSRAVDLLLLTVSELPGVAASILYSDGRHVAVCSTDPIIPSWNQSTPRSYGSTTWLSAVPLGVPLLRSDLREATPRSASWLAVAAGALPIPPPAVQAKQALDRGGSTIPGGSANTGCSILVESLQPRTAYSSTRHPDGDIVDIIPDPWLAPDPSAPDVMYVISRNAVFSVKHGWLAGHMHRAPAKQQSFAAERISVNRVAGGARDICAVVPCRALPVLESSPPRAQDALLVWSLGMNECVTLSSAPTLPHEKIINGVVEIVKLPIATSTAAAGGETHGDTGTVGTATTEQPFQLWVNGYSQLLHDASSGRIFKVASDMKDKEPMEYLAAAAEGVASVAAELQQFSTHTHARARTIASTAASCRARTETLQASLQSLQSNAGSLHLRVQRAQQWGEILRRRAESLVFALSLAAGLSRAEQAYFDDMNAFHKDLQEEIKPKLEKIKQSLSADILNITAAARDVVPTDVGHNLGLAWLTSAQPVSINASLYADLMQKQADLKLNVGKCEADVRSLVTTVKNTESELAGERARLQADLREYAIR